MSSLPRILSIVGPTGSGKTALGISLARGLDGEVICVDSRTIYRGMSVGTAKPVGEWVRVAESRKQKAGGESILSLFGRDKALMVEGVPHWGLDLVDADEEFGAAQFKEYAEGKIKEILKRGKQPILVGGTGMWIWTIVDNLTLTETPPNAELRARFEVRALDDLFAEYKRLDPQGAEVIDRDNKRRVMRALEVTHLTGKPFSQQIKKGEPKYDFFQIGIDIDRDVLNERLNNRVDEMIANGLINEVRALHQQYGSDTTAMTGIGYRQLCFFLEGKANLAAAIDDIKRATRAYAKRQMTWFRRDARINWI